MSKRSQKRAVRILALISVGLLAALVALTARYVGAKFPDAEHANEVALPSIDAEAALIALVLAVLAWALFFALGRPVAPDVEASGWRSILRDEPHPAVFGRLCRWNRANSTDLAVTIMRLIRKGVIRVRRGTRLDALGKEASDYQLVEARPAAGSLHPIDDAALKFIFDIVGGGGSSVWLGEIHSFGRHRADSFSQAMRTWQATVSREVKRSGYFSRASEVAHVALLSLALAAALGGLLATLGTQSVIPVVCGAASGVVLWLAARQMPQHTQAGANAYAAAKALRAHLREGGAQVDEGEVALDLSPRHLFTPELVEYAYVLREIGAACETWPGLAAFCDELTTCIGSTAFAAESTVAYQNLRALNSPVRGATLDYAGVTGLANPEEDAEGLFSRRV